MENFLKIVKLSGLFNRDMRVAPISIEFKKTGTYERPIWGALNSNSEAFSEFSLSDMFSIRLFLIGCYSIFSF